MYRLKDVMEMFNIPERTIRRHIKEGLLAGVKVGGVWNFTKDDLNAYLKNDRVQKHIKDEGFKDLSDFHSGYVEDKSEVIYMMIKEFRGPNSLERFMAVSNLFEHKFSLNCHRAIGLERFIFKGQASDVLILMEWGEKFEEII